MSFIEQDSRNSLSAPGERETEETNFYAFFDTPSPDNLAANRNGILSTRQQSAIKKRIENHKLMVTLMMGMVACTGLFAFFIIWQADREDGVLSLPDLILSGSLLALLTGVFGYFLTGGWFVFFTGDDIEGGTVESGVGRVTWRGSRYQMRTASRQLRALHGVRLPPLGDYCFYYLPHTGLVVTAETITKASAETAVPSLLQVLASVNNFSLEDLAQNQKGHLSLRQENRLLGMAAFSGAVMLSGLALFVSMTFQIVRGASSTMDILLFLIGAILLLRFGWSTVRLIVDIWVAKVIHVEGLVSRKIHRARYSESYYYVLGLDQFHVSYAAYHALLEGKPYRIYFVPRSKQLVAIEPLPN